MEAVLFDTRAVVFLKPPVSCPRLRVPPLGQPGIFPQPVHQRANGYSFILRSSASASASLPCSRRKRTRFLPTVIVLGCLIPRAFSKIANARRHSGSASPILP